MGSAAHSNSSLVLLYMCSIHVIFVIALPSKDRVHFSSQFQGALYCREAIALCFGLHEREANFEGIIGER